MGRYDDIPPEYRILPADIPHVIPGFEDEPGAPPRTLAPRERDSREWFHAFVDRLIDACGRRYLPVCRLSDGEYKFFLGEQPPDLRMPPWERAVAAAKQRYHAARRGRIFEAWTLDIYHSGRYTRDEMDAALPRYHRWLADLGRQGILACHLTYGVPPFQERYHPALDRWLRRHQLALTDESYVPFYFVYAALTGPRRRDLLGGRRVLIVNGGDEARWRAFEAGLRREGVAEVGRLPISMTRSLFDELDVAPHAGRYDLAVVGAGIGKPNVLRQLEPLGIPCIDAGFVFAVWEDPNNGPRRVYCNPTPLPPPGDAAPPPGPGDRR